jgi:hypothetical protein
MQIFGGTVRRVSLQRSNSLAIRQRSVSVGEIRPTRHHNQIHMFFLRSSHEQGGMKEVIRKQKGSANDPGELYSLTPQNSK